MIEYNGKVWLRHVLDFHKVDTFRALLPETAAVALYTGLIVALEQRWSSGWTDRALLGSLGSITTIHSLLGFIISLLLVFRTNSAYERWWEARKLWGNLVNASRNLAIKFAALVPPQQQAERQRIARTLGDFAVALKDHLRSNRAAGKTVDEAVPATGAAVHPSSVAAALYQQTQALVARGELNDAQFWLLDRELAQLVDILGACERIRNTPIPYSYNIFIKKFIFFYVATLPLGFAALFHYWAIPLIAFLFYVLVSLELIAEEIEEPFGVDPNDLPTDALASAIGRDVERLLGSDA